MMQLFNNTTIQLTTTVTAKVNVTIMQISKEMADIIQPRAHQERIISELKAAYQRS